MTRRRILIVDDDVSLTRALALYLTENGCDVRVENDGTRAVVVAREFEPDLIFLDILMPDTDGGTLASEIQADPRLRGTPIVFLTALVSRSETGGTPKRIGGYPFLAKPVHPEVVLAYIHEHALNRA